MIGGEQPVGGYLVNARWKSQADTVVISSEEASAARGLLEREEVDRAWFEDV